MIKFLVVLALVWHNGEASEYVMASLADCVALSARLALMVESADCYTEFQL